MNADSHKAVPPEKGCCKVDSDMTSDNMMNAASTDEKGQSTTCLDSSATPQLDGAESSVINNPDTQKIESEPDTSLKETNVPSCSANCDKQVAEKHMTKEADEKETVATTLPPPVKEGEQKGEEVTKVAMGAPSVMPTKQQQPAPAATVAPPSTKLIDQHGGMAAYQKAANDLKQEGGAPAKPKTAAPSPPRQRRGTNVIVPDAASELVSTDVKTSSFKNPMMNMGMGMGRLHANMLGENDGLTKRTKQEIQSEDIPDWIRKFENVIGHVNQYILFDKIGSGAQGSVYKCLNMKDKKIYAIKALEHASLKRRRKVGSNVNSLKNEIAIMKMLDHPNLVKLYDVIDDAEQDMLYLVMDYVEGGNVMGDRDVMTATDPLALAIPEEKAKPLFADFIAGMEHLHGYGVLHRDIKPSNMLIDNNTQDGVPRLKVCDFGVSSLCSNSKSAKVLGEDDLVYCGGYGTVAMMSPEALGHGPDNIYHGRPADVWAAGVTLYCMLVGTLPFKGSNMDEMKAQIVEETVSFPSKPKISKEAKKLILKMLQKDANARATMSTIRKDAWLQSYTIRKESSENLIGDFDSSGSQHLYSMNSADSEDSTGFFRSRSKSSSSKASSGSRRSVVRSPRDFGVKVGHTFQAMFNGERKLSKTSTHSSEKRPSMFSRRHDKDKESSTKELTGKKDSLTVGDVKGVTHKQHIGRRDDGSMKHFGVDMKNVGDIEPTTPPTPPKEKNQK